MVGSSIGPYVVVEKLGAGGMGEVYLAQDTRLKRKVALKVVSNPALDIPDARQQILAEARAAARLTHPNIATVYDVLDAGERPCIVMEYVDGETLEERLRRGPMECGQTLRVGIQLADALAHAHAGGVVHRDLKPGNVAIMEDGTVKVLDFGIARIHEVGAEGESDTLSRQTLDSLDTKAAGTPAYMAPEQILGKRATPLTDIYSLGVLLFELLSGRRPFAGCDFMALGMAVLTDPVPRLPAETGAPPGVADVVERAMAREPAARFQSAAELSSALRREAHLLTEQPTMLDLTPLPGGAGNMVTAGGGVVGRSPRSWRLMLALVAALIVLAGVIIVPKLRTTVSTPAASNVPVVAILPLANLSGDPTKDYVGVGVAESLITALATMPGVAVVSHDETGRYLTRGPTAGKIISDLGATLLVDGIVQQAQETLHFTLKVLRPDSRVVWAHTYDGAATELLQLQARAAEDLTAALGIHPVSAEADRPVQSPPSTVEAYADYSMGRALLARRDIPGNTERAVAAFEKAVKKDGRFGLAWAGLGDACWWRYTETKEGAWVPRAVDAIRRAIGLDPLDARIRVSLATVYLGTGRSRDAITELQSAIAKRPNDDEAHRLLAEALEKEGKPDDAVREYKKAIDVRPKSFRNYSALGGFYFRRGRYADAADAYKRVTELQPDSTWGFINLGAAYSAAGDNKRALENFERSLTLAPEAETYSNIGTIHYAEGRYEQAAAAYEKAVALGPRNDVSHGNLGYAYLRLGATDKARAEYRQAANLNGDLLKVDPHDAAAMSRRALYLAKAGDRFEALRYSAQAVRMRPDDNEILYKRAIVHALCGQPDEAVPWLERALARGYSRTLAAADDDLGSIRRLPRVQAALREIRVP